MFTIVSVCLGCAAFSSADCSPASATPTSPRRFAVIAHRGGAGSAPENTLPAFRRSLALGFDEVELDVRLSSDAVPMLFHDSELERKTGRPGAVSDYLAAELSTFEIGTWFDREHPEVERSFAGTRLIALATLFRNLGAQPYYHVEIKGEDPRAPGKVLEQIDAFELRSRVAVTSFSWVQIARFRQLAPEVPLCWILERDSGSEGEPGLLVRQRRAVDRASNAGFEQVALHVKQLSVEVVAYAHARGLAIRAWGIDSPRDDERAISSGSDGATTDFPRRLLQRLESNRAPNP